MKSVLGKSLGKCVRLLVVAAGIAATAQLLSRHHTRVHLHNRSSPRFFDVSLIKFRE